ncbi:uncharacterized protein AruCF_3044 [Achromobacter ruhlandii]|nr:uncharacterized protein AruCF_3044 [Achromobacter ruhlandii]
MASRRLDPGACRPGGGTAAAHRGHAGGARHPRRLRLPVPAGGLPHFGKPAAGDARRSLLDVDRRRAGEHADGRAGGGSARHPAGRRPGPAAAVVAAAGIAHCRARHRAIAQHPGTAAIVRLVWPLAAPAGRAPGVDAAAVRAAVEPRAGIAGAAWLAAVRAGGGGRRAARLAPASSPRPRRALGRAGGDGAGLGVVAWRHHRSARQARPGPARRLAAQHRIRRPGDRPGGVPCGLHRRHRARRRAGGAGRPGGSRPGHGADALGRAAPRCRALCRARGSAPLRQPVPGAGQEQHPGHRHRLPGADGRDQHRHHPDRAGAGRHHAGRGRLPGPGPGAGRRAVGLERAPRPPRPRRQSRRPPGRAARVAPAGARGTRHQRLAGRGADDLAAGRRRLGVARLGAAARRLERQPGHLRRRRGRLLGRRGREPAVAAVRRHGAGRPRAGAGRLRRPARRRGGRAGGGSARGPPAPGVDRADGSPSRRPRWAAGRGAAAPSARCAGAACW